MANHLKKHPRTGNFYFRQAVPKGLQALLGKTEVFHNLETKNFKLATYYCCLLSAQTLVHFEQIRELMKKSKKIESETVEGQELIKAREFIKTMVPRRVEEPILDLNILNFEAKANLLTGEISLKTDPNNPADVAAGEEWQKKTFQQMKDLQQSLPKDTGQFVDKLQNEQNTLVQSITGGLKKRIRLKIAFNEYKTTKGGKQATLAHTIPALEAWVNYAVEKFPTITVNQVTSDMIKEYREIILNAYNHKTKKNGIDRDTVNKKLGFIKAFFEWCQKTPQGYFRKGSENNPTFELFFVEEYKDDVEKERSKFTRQELSTIFNPEVFLAHAVKPHQFWPLLISLYTGSRLNEICMLNTDQGIEQDFSSQVWFIDYKKGLKNYNSKRTVPLHPKLIELGLFDYIEDLKTVFPNPANLFPYLIDADKAVGNNFRNYLIDLGLKESDKVFHSFRHTLINAMTTAGVSDPWKKHYTGHKDNSVQAVVYDEHQHPFQTYLKQIEKIQYDIDIEALKYKKGTFLQVLKNEKLKHASKIRNRK